MLGLRTIPLLLKYSGFVTQLVVCYEMSTFLIHMRTFRNKQL